MHALQLFPKKYGFFPYIFLAYLLLPLNSILDENGVKAVVGYALILLFLISYRQLFWYPPAKVFFFWLAIQMSIITVLCLWYHSENIFMCFFPANFIGWLGNKKQFQRAFGAFIICVMGITLLLALYSPMMNILYYLPFLVVMLISPLGIRSMNKRMELEKKLDQANEQIKELIKREERMRIARDLHDTLGHTLSLITLQSQLIQRLIDKQPERAKSEAKEMEITSRSALSQVRELVADMRAHTIAEELVDMERILAAAGIQLIQEGRVDFSTLLPLQQNILAMCLREAGTNIVKHSSAKHCVVTFQETKGYFSIIVQDDGVGMAESDNEGNGIKGMKERLALIDGELELEWKYNKGTTVKMLVPVIIKSEEIAL